MTVRGADYPRRPRDDYPTPPEAVRCLFDNVQFSLTIFDPACGKLNRIVKVAREMGKEAMGRDLVNGHDFLTQHFRHHVDIVTNPPYGDRRGTLTLRFIERSLQITQPYHGRVAMLLPIDFDSGKTRQHVFQHPAFALKLVLLDRIKWFDGQSGSTNHCWCIWNWAHRGSPIIKYARIEE